MTFVDTNIFVRYLTQDDPVKAQACYELFKQAAANQITLITTEAVIAEIVYILASKRLYNLARGEIRARLYPLLSVEGLRLDDRNIYLRALDVYATYSIDFEDALIVARMAQQDLADLYSYDRDFDQIPKISRREP